MSILPLLVLQQPAIGDVPIAMQTVIVFRSSPSSAADGALTPERRLAKLNTEGYVALGLDETGLRAYADPALITGLTASALNRLTGLFRANTPVRTLMPADLGPEDQRSLIVVLANSLIDGRLRDAAPGTAVRVSLAASASVDLDVDGRTVKVMYDPPIFTKSDDPVTFPKGLDLPLSAETMVIESFGASPPGALRDAWTLKAHVALNARRKNARDAFARSVFFTGQRALMEGNLTPGADRLNALPPTLQEDLRKAIKHGYQVYGFKSEQQGLDALESGRLSNIDFGATIYFSRPGIPGIYGFDLRSVRF